MNFADTVDAPTPAGRDTRELCGTVARVLWCADDSSAVIATLAVSHAIVKGKIDGQPLELGTPYRFLGQWTRHAKHGEQFAFDTFVRDTPLTRAGVVKYLTDECPGIGRKKAVQLCEEFGPATVEVVRTQPDRIAARGYLTNDQAAEAAEALTKIAALERTRIDLFGLFAGRGFSGHTINAAITTWGARAADIIRRNPFAMLVRDIPGVGFKRADKLYCDLGRPQASLKRQALCLWHYLRTASQGDTWVLATAAARAVQDACGKDRSDPVRAAKLMRRAHWLSSRRDSAGLVWFAEAAKARAEWTISERVRVLLSGVHQETHA